MKPASEWDLNHILQLPLGEFDSLEFKGRKSLDTSTGVDENKVLDELSKQLSAFANSGGGVLVYGITNPMNGSPRSIDDGGVTFSVKKPNIREWLEDIIPNLVEFPLKKFNVFTLTNKAGAPGLADDRCIILVDIPDSEEAPHQAARDHKYYARVGGKSRPVGHRIVTDMFHRNRYARFEVMFAFQSETWYPRYFPMPLRDSKPTRGVKLIAAATNKGRVYAKYVGFHLWIPAFLLLKEDVEESLCEIEGVKYSLQERQNTRRDLLKHHRDFGSQYGPSWYDPILPGLARVWTFNCIRTLRPEQLNDQKLRWEVHGDNSPTSSGSIPLKKIPFDVRDKHQVSDADLID